MPGRSGGAAAVCGQRMDFPPRGFRLPGSGGAGRAPGEPAVAVAVYPGAAGDWGCGKAKSGRGRECTEVRGKCGCGESGRNHGCGKFSRCCGCGESGRNHGCGKLGRSCGYRASRGNHGCGKIGGSCDYREPRGSPGCGKISRCCGCGESGRNRGCGKPGGGCGCRRAYESDRCGIAGYGRVSGSYGCGTFERTSLQGNPSNHDGFPAKMYGQFLLGFFSSSARRIC